MNKFMNYLIGTPRELYDVTKAKIESKGDRFQRAVVESVVIVSSMVLLDKFMDSYTVDMHIENLTLAYTTMITSSTCMFDLLTRGYNIVTRNAPAGIVGSVRSWFKKEEKTPSLNTLMNAMLAERKD